jgi:flagellar capping protein FliD
MSSNNITNAGTASATTIKQREAWAAQALAPGASALKKADTRVQSQLDSTVSSISGLGKFKAAVSEVQMAARTLSGLNATSNSDDAKKALTNFTSSFNAVVAETKSITAESSRTGQISRGMNRAVNSDLSKINELRSMGLTTAADGSLKIDVAKFDAAYKADPSKVRESMSKLGRVAEKTAEKELGSEGKIATYTKALINQSTALQQQQSALLKVSQLFSQQGTGTSFFSTLFSSNNSNYLS